MSRWQERGRILLCITSFSVTNGIVSIDYPSGIPFFSCNFNKIPIQWHLLLPPLEDFVEMWHCIVIKPINCLHAYRLIQVGFFFSFIKCCTVSHIFHILLISFEVRAPPPVSSLTSDNWEMVTYNPAVREKENHWLSWKDEMPGMMHCSYCVRRRLFIKLNLLETLVHLVEFSQNKSLAITVYCTKLREEGWWEDRQPLLPTLTVPGTSTVCCLTQSCCFQEEQVSRFRANSLRLSNTPNDAQMRTARERQLRHNFRCSHITT